MITLTNDIGKSEEYLGKLLSQKAILPRKLRGWGLQTLPLAQGCLTDVMMFQKPSK